MALLFAFPTPAGGVDEARLTPTLWPAPRTGTPTRPLSRGPSRLCRTGLRSARQRPSLCLTLLRGRVESLLHSLEQGPDLSLDTAREDLVKSAMRLRQAHLSRSLATCVSPAGCPGGGRRRGSHRRTRSIEDCRREYLEVHRQSYAVTLFGRSRRGSTCRDGAAMPSTYPRQTHRRPDRQGDGRRVPWPGKRSRTPLPHRRRQDRRGRAGHLWDGDPSSTMRTWSATTRTLPTPSFPTMTRTTPLPMPAWTRKPQRPGAHVPA